MSENKILYINFDSGQLTDSEGGILTNYPSISYQSYPNWELHFISYDQVAGAMVPVNVSEATAWQSAVDTDFDISTDPMIRTLPSSIITTGAASGIIIIPLNAGTTKFLEKVNKKNSIPAYFEARGRDGDDRVIYDYRFRINALGAIDPEGGEPIPVESGGVTMADVLAITNGKQDTITNANKLSYSLVSGMPEIPTAVSQLTNDVGYITSSALSSKQDTITNSNKLSYDLLSGTPEIPTVGSATLTITSDGSTLGTFSANATTNVTIDIPVGGGSGGVTSGWVNTQISAHNTAVDAHSNILSGKQDLISNSNKLDYSLISGAPSFATETYVNNAVSGLNGFTIVQVAALPVSPDNNTIYLVTGV